MNSLVCIGVPTTSGGKGVGGKVGGSWSWIPSLPDHSPCSSSLPACSSSLPACSSLLPAHSSSLPARSQWPMYVWGSPPLLGCKGLEGKVGASWSKLGSKLEWAEASWSELERAGTSWSELEWAGSKLSVLNVILGFRIPTTFGRKTSIIPYSAYVSPPPGSKIPTQCPLT